VTAPLASDSPVRRLRRLERRDQILAAATRAFARAGFAATSLDDIAAEAHVSRVILYRHFESKTDLYRGVLKRVSRRLQAAVGSEEFTSQSIDALLEAAAEDPDGFRLLFHHAAREPEFRADVDRLRTDSVEVTMRYLAKEIADPAWATWAAELTPTVAIDGVIAWLDAGRPDPALAADRIRQVLGSVVAAAQGPTVAQL
jgi:AcrR family transcriptional regulator